MVQTNQIRTYDPTVSVVFLKTNERFGGLSNMAPGFPLLVNGIRIRTSEALYQACRFPHMPDLQQRIINEASPMTAKMRSKPFRKESRPDWDTVRVKIMRWCLRVKLAQNWRTFGELLLLTGDRPIVEQSRKDDFWGAKVAANGALVGMNVLGRLLMELREQLKAQDSERLKVVEPLAIPEFLLFLRPIEPVYSNRETLRSVVIGHDQQPPSAPLTQRELKQLSFFEQPQIPRSLMKDQTNSAKGFGYLQPYGEYKESGQSFGKIPAHWNLFRNGRLFSQRNETGHGDLPILEVSLKTGVRVRDMDNLKRKQVMSDREKYKRAAQGDIAYNMMRMWQGAVGVAPVDGLVSPAYVVVRPFPGVDCHYFAYLFRTPSYMNEVDGYSRGIVKDRNRLYWQDFKRMPSVVPPINEQKQIARFLDAVGGKVHRFIRNKRRLIELLKEQKQNIINQAVTRGLNPNVKFKPSGMEWIGDIPEHWDVRRLKYLARIRNGQDYKNVEAANGYPVIGSGGQFAYASIFMYEGESVLFGRKGTIDKPLYMNGAFWTVDTMFYTEVSKLVAAKFLYYSALSFPFDYYSTKTALPSMTQQDLGNHPVAFPPLDEQKEILVFIEDESRPIDQVISRAEREIELMREYRTRLISDVVTGKGDVQGIQVPEISEDELAALEEESEDVDEVIGEEESMDETD